MTDKDDHALAFAMAALAPAAVTGLVVAAWIGAMQMTGGLGAPLFAGAAGFVMALFIAGLHIGLLAVPLYALLSRRGPPRPRIILASAMLIGALPIPLISQGDAGAFVIFGLEGLISGVAFCAVTYRSGEQ